MWWDKVIFGWEAYHVVLWFITYSILGWIVESTYMSICNRRMINRGFTRGPICPIYGVGALTVFFLLNEYSDSPVRLFFYGMILATAIEVLTAIVMLKVFGEFWWDYTDKPFNIKGVVCLESSVAWGLYTVGLFAFLQNFVAGIVESIPVTVGKIGGSFVLLLYSFDFLTSFYKERKEKKVLTESGTKVYTDGV